jgi:polyphosphate kinase 2 (PPK2 family)
MISEIRADHAGFALSIEAASDSSDRSRLSKLERLSHTTAGAAMTRRTKIILERKKLRLSQLAEHGSIARTAYFKELGALQLKLQRIQQAYLFTGDSAVIVFEGWDAAGKGGTIRRMSAVLDPRGFEVWPIAAPRAFEKERHYLFRFWERLPPQGCDLGIRPLLVRPCPGRAGRGHGRRARMAARLRRDQRV